MYSHGRSDDGISTYHCRTYLQTTTGGTAVIVVSLQSPRYPQSNAPISKHIEQVYCNVVYVRGYPMNIIPAVIRRYLPFSPTYEADDCIVVILSLFCIKWAWFEPLNRTFCQSHQLGMGLHCQFSR